MSYIGLSRQNYIVQSLPVDGILVPQTQARSLAILVAIIAIFSPEKVVTKIGHNFHFAFLFSLFFSA